MKKFLFVLFPCLLALTACSEAENTPAVEEEELQPAVLTELVLNSAESRAAEQIQSFNSDFFKAVVAENPWESNIVCSPLSASLLLSMVANAADGEVSDEIVNALGCNDLPALNSLSYKYLAALPNVDKAVTFTSANAVWYDNRYTIKPEFAKICKNYYFAPAEGRDFKGNRSSIVNEINSWCKEKTNGIIDKMINELPAGAVSVLADAIYFKGQWGIPFREQDTENMDFFGADGTTTVKMMHKCDYQHCLSTDDFQAVKMQIGDGLFEAIFILPEGDLDSFIAEADFNAIVTGKYTDECIHYYLPRFKYSPEESLNINGALARLGIESLCKEAPLNMFTSDVSAPHEIYQKTGVEFTEEGAEGASVTMDLMVMSTGEDDIFDEPATIKFDHPFAFIIRETTTGVTLFAGKISNL